MKKYQKFLSENFHFLVVKFSVYFNRYVFVMLFSIVDTLVGKMELSALLFFGLWLCTVS